MSEQQAPYTTTTSANAPIKVTYNDRPEIRQWLMDLRRDLLRKVKQIDELLNALPADNQ